MCHVLRKCQASAVCWPARSAGASRQGKGVAAPCAFCARPTTMWQSEDGSRGGGVARMSQERGLGPVGKTQISLFLQTFKCPSSQTLLNA